MCDMPDRDLDSPVDVMDDREEALEKARVNEIVNEWLAGYKLTLYHQDTGFHEIINNGEITSHQGVSNALLSLLHADNDEDICDVMNALRSIIMGALEKAAEDKIEEDNWRIE